MNKSKIILTVAFGILVSGALMVSAFTEPTAAPGSTTSYPPINLSANTQIITAKSFGIGTGSTPADTTSVDETNGLYVSGVIGSDNLDVRQNAVLVGNTTVKGNYIVSGLIRTPQLFIPAPGVDLSNKGGTGLYTYSATDVESATETTPSIYLYSASSNGITTNLGMGICKKVTNSSCPAGSILSKYNPATGVSSCREINPSASADSLNSC